jgi:hypothetical protein
MQKSPKCMQNEHFQQLNLNIYFNFTICFFKNIIDKNLYVNMLLACTLVSPSLSTCNKSSKLLLHWNSILFLKPILTHGPLFLPCIKSFILVKIDCLLVCSQWISYDHSNKVIYSFKANQHNLNHMRPNRERRF